MIDRTPVLRGYEESMLLSYAETLTVAVITAHELPPGAMSSRVIARFVIDANSLTRRADDPDALVDKTFRMIEAALDGHRSGRNSSAL
ncbi:hypothetical protein [Nocardia sp. NPDC047654]|uniref:hypothetical protein n=1 Tax=Nocardia sp. NPDC047654 TaxID=3364314 RepID=UPI00371B3D30